MKIIVAHPGKQHSYRLASAINKSGNLLYYCTTLYNKPGSLSMFFSKLFLRGDNLKKAKKRINPDLDNSQVLLFGEIGGLFEALLYRLDKNKRIYEKIRRFNSKRFGIKVAKLAIKNKVDAIIMYDTNATEAFKYLSERAPNIIRILDVSIAIRPYMKHLFQRYISEQDNNLLFLENSYIWNEKENKKCLQEIYYTNHFFVPSSFVRESLISNGIAKENIHLIPYGLNIKNDYVHSYSKEGPLKLLFVGQVVLRKGIDCLLRVVSKFEKKDVVLYVVGSYDKKSNYYINFSYCENISFLGSLTFDKMENVYNSCDVFVLDSLAEGMALVGLEALGCGLPIICSKNSGLDSIVLNNENGFIIEPNNEKSLYDKIEFFLKNRTLVELFGKKSREISRNFTWDRYSDLVNKELFCMLKEHDHE